MLSSCRVLRGMEQARRSALEDHVQLRQLLWQGIKVARRHDGSFQLGDVLPSGSNLTFGALVSQRR